ncbi:SdrD B-like domain-containing protein [Microbacterium sp. No. 7]|uniref:SdrD B-like domain-containing protein n=1 Tax=Microbacterium sp. No. 7 TaxID=1714373 RepID=UPI0006CF2CED|nr:SdrD B-like domain-containing protein [Microbacterium sp. No. 7]ALJ21357.1 hypothetical protein AOA12_16185 [Microbacterium sp. No. 7]
MTTPLSKQPPPRRGRGLALATTAILAGTSVLTTAPAAFADAGDGTLTVTVVEDVNHDHTRDAGDIALESVKVRITDAQGNWVEKQTGADGSIVLAPGDSGNDLVGGTYRVAVTNPKANTYSESYLIDGYAEPQFSPATSFVDLSGGTDIGVSVGYIDVTKVGYANATIYSATQPDSIWPSGKADALEVYQTPYRLDSAPTAITTDFTLGALYGIGLDRDENEIYAGAYAKRGSDYGPGGAGAIYRVDPASGAWEQYVTVADAGTTAHDFDEMIGEHQAQDFSFRSAVGRESLGDVEVTEDAAFLLAINMHTDSVVVYPVQDAVDPAPIQTLAIPAIDCSADWAPMAITENILDGDPNEGKIYIGATCGATMQASIIEYEISAGGELSPTGTVWTGDPTTAPGSSGVNSAGSGAAECWPVDWRVWTDEIPQACVDASANWSTPPNPAGVHVQYSVPQPMLSDIEFLETGELVLAFRDRGGDQNGPILYAGEKTNGYGSYMDYIVAGNVHAVSIEGSTIDFDARPDAPRGGDFYDIGFSHNEAAFGGIVYVPGTERIVGNQMDVLGIYQQGLRAWDPLTGDYAASKTGTPNQLVGTHFRKGQGLADMEAYYRLVDQQIGNRIWIDTDADGIQDAGEPAVAGVQVSLYDEDGTLIATTETDAKGEYYFSTSDGVQPGVTYEVRLDRAADFEAGGPLAGLEPTRDNRGGDRGIDSNGKLVDGVVVAEVITGADGVNDHSIDFGFLPGELVSIGDYLWIDENGDGFQDAGEKPVPGAVVKLLDKDGTVIAETTTDDDGYYVFADLPGDTEFVVQFPTTVRVDGQRYTLTAQGADTAAANDSNADPATGQAPVRTPDSGLNSSGPGEADDPTVDAGYVLAPAAPLVSIGNFLWVDADGDGIQDPGEAPVAGATVRLLDENGIFIKETVTDENGFYVFTDLEGSTDYIVEFPTTVTVGGEDLSLTSQRAGSDTAADSNPAPDTGRAPVTTPATGNNSAVPGEVDDPTIDAGYARPPAAPVSIGDYLWVDVDGNGVQDAGEYPVGGATVRLLDADGNLVKETTTDGNGFYAFTDLRPSTDYIVEFPTSVTVGGSQFVLTEPGRGGDETADSNPAKVTGRAPVTTPDSGDNSGLPGETDDPTIDAGYVESSAPLVSIGDYVWIDADGDGIQDGDENPVPGAVVKLLDADGNVVATTTTDANGYYVFANLPVETDFIVEFPTTVTLGGVEHTLTAPGQGGDEALDSNPDVATGRAPVTTPASGSNSTAPGQADVPTVDAGFVPVPPTPLVSVGDYVWIDADRDGIQDDGEKPAAGVTVKLLDADGNVVQETVTDENGYYVFSDLPVNTDFIVEFPVAVTVDGVKHTLTRPGQGGDEALDSNPDVATGRAPVTTPGSGSNSTAPGQADVPTVDAGFVPELVSVGDYVWIDADGDGIQDADEPPLEGITVRLYDKDGNLIKETVTDENGYYVFTDLVNSTEYIIEFPTTTNIGGVPLTLTQPNAGSDDARDSDADPVTGRVTVTTPTEGDNSAEPGKADNPTVDAGFALSGVVQPTPTPTPVEPTPTPTDPTPTPTDPTPTPTEPTPTPTPVEPTPTPTPVEPTPTEPTPTPIEPTPTPIEPTPTPTPVEPTPTEPTPTPIEPTPTPIETPIEPTPTDPTPTPVEPKPTDPTPTVTPGNPVSPPADPGANGGLAATGGQIPWFAAGAGALLLLVGGFMVARRRRGNTEVSAE